MALAQLLLPALARFEQCTHVEPGATWTRLGLRAPGLFDTIRGIRQTREQKEDMKSSGVYASDSPECFAARNRGH